VNQDVWLELKPRCKELKEVAEVYDQLSGDKLDGLNDGKDAVNAIMEIVSKAGLGLNEYPQQGWFSVLSDLNPQSLVLIFNLWIDLETKVFEVEFKNSHTFKVVRFGLMRAVLMLLQEAKPLEISWSLEGGELAKRCGYPRFAVRCYVMCALECRTRAQSNSVRMPSLPQDLADALIQRLCEIGHGADAIVISQMQSGSDLTLYEKYCSGLDKERTMSLWNLNVLEHLMKALYKTLIHQTVNWNS